MPASYLQRYTAELQDRAPLQAQSAIQFWLAWVQLQETVSAGTRSHGVSCLSSLRWTIILAVWLSNSKKTEQ